jgi:hypothetical protein
METNQGIGSVPFLSCLTICVSASTRTPSTEIHLQCGTPSTTGRAPFWHRYSTAVVLHLQIEIHLQMRTALRFDLVIGNTSTPCTDRNIAAMRNSVYHWQSSVWSHGGDLRGSVWSHGGDLRSSVWSHGGVLRSSVWSHGGVLRSSVWSYGGAQLTASRQFLT